MIENTDKIVVTKDQVFCGMDEEVVILSLTRGEYFELNDVGARIWEMIQQPCDLRDIETALLEQYEVEPNILRADIRELIENMLEMGLARIES